MRAAVSLVVACGMLLGPAIVPRSGGARSAKAQGKKLPTAAKQHINDKVRAAFAKLDLNRRD